MGLKGGVVVANPIPLEHEIPAIEITQTIEDALRDAQTQGIQGKGVTPFLLKNIVERTQGRSLKSNIPMGKNYDRLGAHVAVNLTQFM